MKKLLFLLLLISGQALSQTNLNSHAFPALGMTAQRKVDIAWNRFYDTKGLENIIKQIHEAFPDITRLYSIGKSYEGRELWCLEVTSPKGDRKRKPGMYIDGNIHGNEVQASEVVAYTAWYLCHQYGKLEKVTEMVDRLVFYLVPTINPDGRDSWFHSAHTQHSSRTGVKPVDNDGDGLADEDDTDDLDGDGSITMMRIKDPNGRWRVNPDFPEYLMVQVQQDQKGEYTLLGSEGLDNDGDGRVNEDPVGGYDMNRNWGYDWQPNHIQFGAHQYPFSLPETRAVSDFIYAHPNIAGYQSYHNAGGMILRPPGREGGAMNSSDEQVLLFISKRGEQMLPFYRSMIIWKDLYTTWGSSQDFMYAARGIMPYTCELWTPRNLYKTNAMPSREDEAAFIRYVLLNDGLTKWKELEHPTYGKVEVGGTRKEWGRAPLSFLLEEECHRNMAFTMYHADQSPLLSIPSVTVTNIGEGLFKVWVTISNSRIIPTRSAQDTRNDITSPDIVTLEGQNIKVLASGTVRDRYFKRVDGTKRRPHRVEVDTIPGMDERIIQFVVSGSGGFKVTLDSVRGGLLTREDKLP